jgi:hypothetical protein
MKKNFPEFDDRLKFFCWMAGTAFAIIGKTKAELITKMCPEMGDNLMMRLADQLGEEAKRAEDVAGILRQAKYRLMVAMSNEMPKTH